MDQISQGPSEALKSTLSCTCASGGSGVAVWNRRMGAAGAKAQAAGFYKQHISPSSSSPCPRFFFVFSSFSLFFSPLLFPPSSPLSFLHFSLSSLFSFLPFFPSFLVPLFFRPKVQLANVALVSVPGDHIWRPSPARLPPGTSTWQPWSARLPWDVGPC